MNYKTNPIFWLLPLLALSLFLTIIILYNNQQPIKASHSANDNFCFTTQAIRKKDLPPKIISYLNQLDTQIIIDDLLKFHSIEVPTYLVKIAKGRQLLFDQKGDFLCEQNGISK